MARKRSSISYQMTSAIDGCTREGGSKRSYVRSHGGETDHLVFGLTYKNDLCETAKQFGNYVRINHKEIHYVKEITPEVVTEFLKAKIQVDCNERTMEKTYSHLKKINKCLQHKYKISGWDMEKVALPEMEASPKLKDKEMKESDFYKLLYEMKKSPHSEAWKSIVLSNCCGLRVEETANIKYERISFEGGKWGYGTLNILKGDGSKGNRTRICDILSAEDRTMLKEVVKGLQAGERIVAKIEDGKRIPIQGKSITRAIQRAMKKTELTDEYKYNKNHALRKHYAQKAYDKIRTTGITQKEALAYVNTILGHGGNRKDLNHVYVLNQW